MALTPEQEALNFNPDLQDVSRQRKLAEALMSQGLQGQPQGQMISGHYVAPSWSQQINPLANLLAGQAVGDRADSKEQELATALRGKKAEALQQFQTLMSKPETRSQAMQFAAGNQFLQPLVSELMKPQKLGEGENLVMPSIDGGAPINLGAGGAKYHPPTSVDMGTLGTMLIHPDGRREMVQKGVQGPAGQVLETDNGPMLVNTRTGQAQPITANGQAVTGSGKPLTSDQSNATAFGMRMKESNQLLNALEDKGVKNTGIIRSSVAGTLGMTPFIGENLQQGAHAAMNTLPGVMGGPSGEQQQVDAARRNFVTAVLRKESGAAISASEFYNESQKYFPQPGDTNEVIAQKRHARETAIKAMQIQAGPGKRQIEETNLPTDNGVWTVKSVK